MEEPSEAGLTYLLDLDGWVSEVGDGFWIKVCARRTPPSGGKPCGIDYALTLHKPNGQRVAGYDNAHPLRSPGRMGRTRGLASDHRHYRDRIEPYSFLSPERLLEDFWADVERFLLEEGVT